MLGFVARASATDGIEHMEQFAAVTAAVVRVGRGLMRVATGLV
jgi:hypothetical protein